MYEGLMASALTQIIDEDAFCWSRHHIDFTMVWQMLYDSTTNYINTAFASTTEFSFPLLFFFCVRARLAPDSVSHLIGWSGGNSSFFWLSNVCGARHCIVVAQFAIQPATECHQHTYSGVQSLHSIATLRRIIHNKMCVNWYFHCDSGASVLFVCCAFVLMTRRVSSSIFS